LEISACISDPSIAGILCSLIVELK